MTGDADLAFAVDLGLVDQRHGGGDIGLRPDLEAAVGLDDALRKAIELMCPSPTARTDMTKRTAPPVRPDWSGCSTTLGFISAAAA